MKIFFLTVLFFSLPLLQLIAQGKNEKIRLSGLINSKYLEYAPKISPDGNRLYFIRRYHPENLGSKKNYDIWYSQKNKNGKWQKPVQMKPPVNNSYANTIESVMPDGNTLLLGMQDHPNTEANGFYFTHKKQNGWTKPDQLFVKNLSKYNKGRFLDGYLTKDGQTLLLASSKKPMNEINDIYVSFRKGDKNWSEPKSIGKQINTKKFDESTPYLASDGVTLYFSSNRKGGYGNNDIYVTKRQDSTWTNWSKPKNLGSTINTQSWDAYFSLDAKGDSAFVISYVAMNNVPENPDIFKVKVPDAFRPEPVVLVRGKVFDKKNNKPLRATIIYENLEKDTEEGIAHSNPANGKYQLVLPYGKNYGIRAKAEGYIGVSEQINLKKVETYKEVKNNLYLTPIEKGANVRLNNLFFDFGSAKLRDNSKSELKRLMNIMKENQNMKIRIEGHTDSIGNKNKNIVLSRKRAKAVSDFLKTKNISSERITIKGYGSSKPVASNKTEKGRQKNRRVEIKILEVK